MPDGSQLIAGGQDGVLRSWDTQKQAFRVKRTDHAFGTVWMLRITPDGTYAITAHDDGGVRIWNTATWAEPAVLRAEEGTVLSIAVTPDSRTALPPASVAAAIAAPESRRSRTTTATDWVAT